MPTIVGKDNSHVLRATCRNCSSILEYVRSEVTEDYTTDYTGGREYYNYITCPCCREKVDVK